MNQNTPQELVQIEREQSVAVSRPIQNFDIESIFRLAIEKEGTAETLEKLMGIRRELNAEAAKKAYDAALSALQSECPVIIKKVKGATGSYKFAPLDDIMPQVQPLLSKHEFSFSITSEVELNWIKALCKVTHSGGHFEISEFKVPTDARNTMMSDPQRYAGSLTFAKRYAFCNAFGIMTGDEDRDAARQKAKTATGRVVTVDIRNRFFEVSRPWHQKLQAMAIDLGWIMPDEGLDKLTDEHIPTTKGELSKLQTQVEAHQ
jgi:hypothetical protein